MINVKLGPDPLNPTRLKWEQVLGKSKVVLTSADGFIFEGKSTLDKADSGNNRPVSGFENSVLPPMVSEDSGFLSLNSVIPSVFAENMHRDGWALAEAPNGESVLFLQESVRQMDGKVGKLLFAFGGEILKRADYQNGWFGNKYDVYFFPLTYTKEPFNCPEWASAFICENRMKGDAEIITEFIITGNIPEDLEGWFIANPVRGK